MSTHLLITPYNGTESINGYAKTKSVDFLANPSRFKPDLRILQGCGPDLSTASGCIIRHTLPCEGPTGIEPLFTTCKVKQLKRYAEVGH